MDIFELIWLTALKERTPEPPSNPVDGDVWAKGDPDKGMENAVVHFFSGDDGRWLRLH